MKITVRTLNKGTKADSFEIEITAENTILEVKQKVEAARSDFEAAGQKLVCAGKILNNEKTVADYNLKEGDFLVVIPGKKAAPPPEPAPSQPAAAVPAAGDSAAPAPGGAAPAAAAPVSNSREVEAAITQLTEMGFPREECERALRAAYGNPDRAVEYLMNGIPQEDVQMGAGAPEGAPPAVPAGGASAPLGGGAPVVPAGGAAPAAPQPSGVEGFSGMAFPQAQPQGGAPPAAAEGAQANNMDALRQAVEQNPAMLQQVLAELGQQNPQLLQMFQENPQALMQVLAGQLGGGGMPGAPGAGAEPAEIRVQLSPEEQEAVGRLEQLGFPRASAVQAYLAAEKNEELAANLLFDMGDDF